MIPRKYKLEPTTSVKKVSMQEVKVKLTIDNMNCTQDLYFDFETDNPNSWFVCPANSVLELRGDFPEIYYKVTSSIGSGDTVQVIIESDEGEDW